MSSSIAPQRLTESVANMIPQLMETPMNSSIPIWISLRISKRSARAPVKPAKKRYGTQCEMTAKPPSAGE